jgi:hypothetical protein
MGWEKGWGRVTVVAAVVLACGVIGSRPVGPQDGPVTGPAQAAADAIEDLLAPSASRDPLAHLPADFSAMLGATPIVVRQSDGVLRGVHPHGGCSAPWGDDNTTWDYGVGCSAHDLGYDLLRYAAKTGHPLGSDYRARLDDRLKYDMHHQCTVNPKGAGASCTVVAALYGVGLDFNSWRQRWGPPRYEPVWPDLAGLGVVCLLLLVTAYREPPGALSPGHRPGDGGGYWHYLTDRTAALLRPALLFVLGALLVPVLLDAANVPKTGVALLGHLLALPMALLGGYLLLTATAPLTGWLHTRVRPGPPPLLTPTSAPPGHALLSAALGLIFGLLGVLGFVVTGFSGGMGTTTLLSIPVAPLHNLIHLLVGCYLVQLSRSGRSARALPWLLVAVACVPPLFSPASEVNLLLHTGTLVLALGTAVISSPAFTRRQLASAR